MINKMNNTPLVWGKCIQQSWEDIWHYFIAPLACNLHLTLLESLPNNKIVFFLFCLCGEVSWDDRFYFNYISSTIAKANHRKIWSSILFIGGSRFKVDQYWIKNMYLCVEKMQWKHWNCNTKIEIDTIGKGKKRVWMEKRYLGSYNVTGFILLLNLGSEYSILGEYSISHSLCLLYSAVGVQYVGHPCPAVWTEDLLS